MCGLLQGLSILIRAESEERIFMVVSSETNKTLGHCDVWRPLGELWLYLRLWSLSRELPLFRVPSPWIVRHLGSWIHIRTVGCKFWPWKTLPGEMSTFSFSRWWLGIKMHSTRKKLKEEKLYLQGLKFVLFVHFHSPHPLIVFIPIFSHNIFPLLYIVFISLSTLPHFFFPLSVILCPAFFSLSLSFNLFPFCVSNIYYFSLIAFSFISPYCIAISLPLCCLCFFPSLSVDKHCYSDQDSCLVCYTHNVSVFVLYSFHQLFFFLIFEFRVWSSIIGTFGVFFSS